MHKIKGAFIKTIFATIIAFVSFTLINCGGNDDNGTWTDDGGNNHLTASTLKTEYQAFEIATLSLTNSIDAGDYSGGIDSVAISLKAEDSLAWFMVPNLTEGYYDGWFEINGDTFWFGFDILPNQITDADAEINNFINEQADIQKELDAYIDSLIFDSMPGFEDALADKQVWIQMAQASKTEIENLDANGKMALAQLLSVNKGLIEELDNMIIGSIPGFKRSTKEQCEALIKQGRQELKDGKKWASLGTRVSAYWCALKFVAGHENTEVTKKISVLFDNMVLGPGMSALNTITNFVGRKIDCLTKTVQDVTKKAGIADLLEELEDAKKQKVLNFRDGEPEGLVAKIRFRSIGSDDKGKGGAIGGTADFFDELIGVYNKMIETSEQPLIWRPGFEPKRYAVRKFNRFLSIDESTVSNSDIVLINTQVTNDIWEAAFGNDGDDAEPEFTFELVYDDGEIKLQHTVNAKIVPRDFLDGTWSAISIENQALNTVHTEYHNQCSSLKVREWLFTQYDFTFSGGKWTLTQKSSSTNFTYINLNDISCTFSSIETENISDDNFVPDIPYKYKNNVITYFNDNEYDDIPIDVIDQNTFGISLSEKAFVMKRN